MFSLVLLAAGSGQRMNLGYNKMLYEIDNTPIIKKCYDVFKNNINISEIIIVSSKEDLNTYQDILKDENIKYVIGGSLRYESVKNGLEHVSNEYCLIHDGARCFITDDLINKIINATKEYDCCTLAVQSKDTLHYEEDGFIKETLNRNHTYLAQTPQGFKTSIILEAHNNLLKDHNINVTDDAMLVNTYTNHKVKLVESSYANIKVTTIEDLK